MCWKAHRKSVAEQRSLSILAKPWAKVLKGIFPILPSLKCKLLVVLWLGKTSSMSDRQFINRQLGNPSRSAWSFVYRSVNRTGILIQNTCGTKKNHFTFIFFLLGTWCERCGQSNGTYLVCKFCWEVCKNSCICKSYQNMSVTPGSERRS